MSCSSSEPKALYFVWSLSSFSSHPYLSRLHNVTYLPCEDILHLSQQHISQLSWTFFSFFSITAYHSCLFIFYLALEAMNEAVSRRKMFTKFFTGLALCCILLSLWLVFEQNHLPTVLGHKIIDPLNSISNATREGESANVISHVRNETLGVCAVPRFPMSR